MTAERWIFNGIDAVTGHYLGPPMAPEELARRIRALSAGKAVAAEEVSERWGRKALAEGLDPRHLARTGWGVVLPTGADPGVVEALRPLLDLRKSQATADSEKRYRELEYRSGDGARQPETKIDFLGRYGVGHGLAQPDRMPYYLLIVGTPEEIPLSFQYQLDVQYAVGRLSFETAEEYARYAEAAVAAERGALRRARRATFFAPRNANDLVTARMACELLPELVRQIRDQLREQDPSWDLEHLKPEASTKGRLLELLGEAEGPALVFTACHGLSLPAHHPRQRERQGALVCQDWPGPRRWQEPVSDLHTLAGEDLGASASPAGLVAFHFACFSAGTPRLDDFNAAPPEERREVAREPFVARLPQRLLAHPRGPALAVIGHVDRAWDWSFSWRNSGPRVAVFCEALRLLLAGYPVGAAVECFNARYAELTSDLLTAVQDDGEEQALDDLWTACYDARNYAVIGDPAVRLCAQDSRRADVEDGGLTGE